MTDPFAALYPDQANRLPVLDGVPAPSFAAYSTGLHDGRRPEPDYTDRLLARLRVGRRPVPESLAFVDKLFPHTPFDLMIVADGRPLRWSFADLRPDAGRLVCRLLHQFVSFLSHEDVLEAHQLTGRRVHLCYNFDPHTVDRDNPMAYDKRFHVHLNCWQRWQLDGVTPVPLDSIPDPVRRRDLLDPLAYLGPRVLFDMLTGTAAGLALMEPDPARDLQMRLPVGLKVRLDDWDALRSPRLPELLRALHGGVVGVYGAIRSAFTGGECLPVPWTRPSLLPAGDIERRVKAIGSLTEQSKGDLTRLAEALRDIDDRTMTFFRRHRDLRSRCLALAGPAYSLGFYSPVVDDRDPCLLHQGPVYLVLQPKLFSRLGGAGLAYVDEFPAVRVRRGARQMSGTEERARTRFQRDFLAHVRTDLADEADVRWDPSVRVRS